MHRRYSRRPAAASHDYYGSKDQAREGATDHADTQRAGGSAGDVARAADGVRKRI